MTTPGKLMNNVRFCRGQTKVLHITVKDRHGRAASFSGVTIYFTARKSATDPVLICLNSPDNGIEITNATKGEATITISSTDSEIEKGLYLYDIWIEYSGTPPIRHPVVNRAELCVDDRLATFSCS